MRFPAIHTHIDRDNCVNTGDAIVQFLSRYFVFLPTVRVHVLGLISRCLFVLPTQCQLFYAKSASDTFSRFHPRLLMTIPNDCDICATNRKANEINRDWMLSHFVNEYITIQITTIIYLSVYSYITSLYIYRSHKITEHSDFVSGSALVNAIFVYVCTICLFVCICRQISLFIRNIFHWLQGSLRLCD